MNKATSEYNEKSPEYYSRKNYGNDLPTEIISDTAHRFTHVYYWYSK
jgi:hypothetical protein